jgi:GTP-binding protein HflX
MSQLSGNTTGLKPSQRYALERIYRRRVPPRQVISPELAAFLVEQSGAIERQIGLLIDRRGQIEHVVVGDGLRLWLPDVGRLRARRERLRGVRLVHTHLRGEGLSNDDLTDLAKLRLDLVAAIAFDQRAPQAGPLIHCAHLLPPGQGKELWRHLPPATAHGLAESLDFAALIRSLEEEIGRETAAVHEVGKERAIVVHAAIGARAKAEVESRVAEVAELCRSANVQVLDTLVQVRTAADPKYLIGKGKLEDLVLRAQQAEADLLVFDTDLTPAQARAITDATELRVIDRTMLILDIFAQRASSSDGKLQVELAQLKYTLPRLVEKNTMMSRLTGGIGGRGPGETKLEINRRRARERITRLQRQLDDMGQRRGRRRALRTRKEVPTVAIVGYTNAGKSTLLNTLTKSSVLAEERHFATLDPASRRLRLPRDRELIIVDTVGFIRDLPRDLVAAFRATLEELGDAALLLHLVDGSDPSHEAHIAAVETILSELGEQLGADHDVSATPRLLVFNKMDRATEQVLDHARRAGGLAISAEEPDSLGPLLAEIERRLWRPPVPLG